MLAPATGIARLSRKPPAALRFLCFALAALLPLLFSPPSIAQSTTDLTQQPSPASSIPSPQVVTVPPLIAEAVDESRLTVLKGNVHPLARAEFDQGAVSDSLPMNRILLLLKRSPDQEAALQQLMEQQQDKSSPNFHAWLTPDQFGKQFGPADADIGAVTTWLQSQGFQVNHVSAGKTVIEFSGTAAQVRSAFRTSIHRFVVNGEDRTANTADPQIPTALAPVLAGVVSLHSFPHQSHARFLGQFRRTLGQAGIRPLFTFPNPSNGQPFYALAPGDFATIYNTKPLLAAGTDGTGQTIAIVGETNINVKDVQQFRSMFGLPPNFDATNIILNGEDPGITSTGEEGEADLDVQWSGAVAPGATIKLVVSASTPASAGIDLSALYIIEKNLAGVMSESYGDCENHLGAAGNAFFNSLWEQAAAQGITVFVSSGDNGSAGCDDPNTQQVATQGLAVSGLASTPFNVSVGGTDFDQVQTWTTYWNATNDTSGTNATGTSAKSYIPEIPWNESCAQIGLTGCGAGAPNGSLNIVAASGGPSSFPGKPLWQMGVAGMPNDNRRDQPDVSLFASPGFDGTGYVYCQMDQSNSGQSACNINAGALVFGIVGGTSASAPAFAGIMALVNQYQSGHGGMSRQGNANYTLYALAKKPGASCTSSPSEVATCVFNDVTKGNSFLPTGSAGIGTNSVPCQVGSANCGSTGVLVDPANPTTEAWTTTAGYDMTAGLGSVNANNLVTNWGTVSTIPTTTTLTLSPTTGINHGTAENVTVGITVKPKTGMGVPAGDVSLIATLPDGTHGIDQFTLVGGAVSRSTQSLPGGTYNVIAHFAGDGTNAPSDSTPVQVTVGKESSQSFIVVPVLDSQGNLNGNATSVIYGSRYIIRMYVTDKNGVASASGPPSPTCDQVNQFTCPTGNATLTANGASVDGGAFILNNQGYTRDIAPALTGGTYSLVAQYSGDSSYQASTSASHPFAVTPTNMQLIISYLTCRSVGTPCTLSVVGGPYITTGAAPTGTLSVYDAGTLIAGPVLVSGSGGQNGIAPGLTASAQMVFSTSGDHPITAKYSGDEDYLPQSASQTIHTYYPTTGNLQATSANILYGSSIGLTATVNTSQKNPTITGQIAFSAPSGTITGSATTQTTDTNGNVMLTATATTMPQASEWITASYSGDLNFDSSSGVVWVNVNIPDFSLGIPANPLVLTAGQPGTLQFTVAPASNNSSPVSLTCNGNLPSGYSCALQPSTVNLANGQPSPPVTLTLSPLPSSAAMVRTVVRRKVGGAFPFALKPNSSWPFSIFACLVSVFFLCLAYKKGNWRAAVASTSILILSLILGCGGGGRGGGGASPPFATSSTVSTSSAKIAQGDSVVFTAKVTGPGNPAGLVDFFANGNWLGKSALIAGTTTLGTPLFYPGIYTITAKYEGDSNNLASTSPSVSESVTGSIVMAVNGQTSTIYHTANITVTVQ